MTETVSIKASQDLLSTLAASGLFSSLDIHFAGFMGRLATTGSPEVILAASLVSRSTGEGNICLSLEEYAGKVLLSEDTGYRIEFPCPALSDWVQALTESSIAGPGEGTTPLVLTQNGKLYLRRYWEYENIVSRFLLERSTSVAADIDYEILSRDLKNLFSSSRPAETDWQKIGAITAVTRPVCIISGGPGTGKTATVARILALLCGQPVFCRRKPRIALGAPTGKAASRLAEAIASAGLEMDELPQASTLHRMLGPIRNSPYFRHNAENPLNSDIIIIDEASMVDLPLMAKLMQAVPDSARLILLGDRHQLASVQPGSVFGDICNGDAMTCFSDEYRERLTGLSDKPMLPKNSSYVKAGSPLCDSLVELTRSYRFPEDSSIARLSSVVRQGDGEGALDILLSGNEQVSWTELPQLSDIDNGLRDWEGFSLYASMLQQKDPDSCFSCLEKTRILCGLRRGPYGAERINHLLSRLLAGDTADRTNQPHPSQGGDGRIPAISGLPVMITRNDYGLKLFNGDIGVLLPDRDDLRSMRACFRDEEGVLRDFALSLLPDHEAVFAMTVHKSQGSEFDSVLIILPDRDSEILTRELLYTAITRARNKVEIWGRKDIFIQALQRRIKRSSGLPETLWGRK